MQQASLPVISIIVPFRYRNGDKECLLRLQNALHCFAGKSDLEVILFDTSPRSFSKQVQEISCLPGVKYFHQYESNVFSPGETRNKAVSKAQGRYLFFFDADLLCTSDFATVLVEQMTSLQKTGRHAFAMFPCLYLSEKATRKLRRGATPDYLAYMESYLRGELSDVDGIAVASSCLLVDRQWFLTIGGFRSEFAGHGCEDFELIHRLAAYFPSGRLPDDYTLDEKKQFPADYTGFRRFYSYYALPHLFTGNFLLHQWHRRPLSKLYHRRRLGNEQLFANIISNISLPIFDGIKPFSSKRNLPEYKEWIIGLMQKGGYNHQEYPGLFHWKDGVSRPSGSWRRKLRKLILKPGQFLKDMV